MATLEELTARRDALIARREAMVTRVKTGDKEVQYDLNQVRAAILEINQQIMQADPTSNVRQIRFVAGKGL